MALGDPYITSLDLAGYLGIGDSGDDALLTSAASSASEWVNRYCDRQFNKTTSATARVYQAETCDRVRVDDFHTTTGLVVKTDTGDNGTYDTTWTTADYVLRPFDGIEASQTGFPYYRIDAVEALSFPTGARPRVQVTAQWGWTAVPESVELATKILAGLLFNLKSAPLGVASFADAGIIRVRDVPPAALMLLDPFRKPGSTGVLVK